MCTINKVHPCLPDGCQVPVGQGVCGETRTLDIINEFKMLYEEKMRQIDVLGGGECLEEKVRLQQDWIGDLSEQNEMLVRAVGELEHEATERVRILEEKLQQSAQCLCEVMKRYREYDVTNDLLAEPLQKMFCLESDQKNLLELLRRAREENQWNVDGLTFFDITYQDLFGSGVPDKVSSGTCTDKCTRDDGTQEQNKLKDRECKIRDLQGKIEYYNSFGNVECMAKDLKCKMEECEALKSTMEDTRQALVEEIAAKHDFILQLKKDCQQLEERCIQADKQTAFKDDIIKELRKEIKQLKQQLTQEEIIRLNCTIDDLHTNLQKTKLLQEEEEQVCKICKGRSKVGFVENAAVQVYLDERHFHRQMEAYEDKDEIIKVQNETLDILQVELLELKQREFEVRKDVESKCNEVQCLKNKIAELENNLERADERTASLLMALENKDGVVKVQNETFNIMQVELQTLKQKEFEVIRNVESKCNEVLCLKNTIAGLENALEDCDGKAANLQMAEHLKQYKFSFRKVLLQKKCYEEVIVYFREEMGLMAQQLCNLQELLTTSNKSTQEESNKLIQAFASVQAINKTLSSQLCAAEQKVCLENQMNQLQEAKIHELKQLLNAKDMDLSRHDEAIIRIRQSLKCSLKQNEEMKQTIVALNSTVANLYEAIRKYETDNCTSTESTQQCQLQIKSCREKLEELRGTLEKKTTDLQKLETAYNSQSKSLKTAQKELKQLKVKQKDKQCHMKCTHDELREKLGVAEKRFSKLSKDFEKIQAKLTNVSKKEAAKDSEVKQYRKIVCDLKNTLIDLNRSLTNRDVQEMRTLQTKCKNEECRQKMKLNNDATCQDICLNCPCEIEFYQSIVETLKKAVIDLKEKLTDSQKRNEQLEEDCKCREAKLVKLSKLHEEKDKEYQDLRNKFAIQLKQDKTEQSRYLDMAAQFEKDLAAVRQELAIRTTQLNEVKKSANEITGSRCVQLACAQEEVNNLKEELNGLRRKHHALNVEHEKLRGQSARLQSTVASLEERSQLLKGQLEQYLTELQSLQYEKETLLRKNRELLSELRLMQCSYNAANKQERDLQCQYSPQPQKKTTRITAPGRKHSPTRACQSPWSLGSQGTASIRDIDSPSRSPCPNYNTDWYSPNFRNDSEDDDEEDWVSKVEDLAAQVRRTNKMWRNKMGQSNSGVSRDTKKE